MERKLYPAIIELDGTGYYFVDFPDLENCFTQGDDFDDACFMAKDILKEWIKDYKQKDNKLPEPSNLIGLQKKYPNAIIRLF